jgi:CHAT domain-containing protein
VRPATESSVRQQAPARAILHFAAHTVIRDDDPFASYLALAHPRPPTMVTAVLTAQDIYQLKLRSDSVVLSGCRSASGTIGGDGVATFARAFLYAGAASLIASVWEVADEPSNRLMPAYYRAWLGGASKAAALRQAQLELLNDLRRGRVSVTTAIRPGPGARTSRVSGPATRCSASRTSASAAAQTPGSPGPQKAQKAQTPGPQRRRKSYQGHRGTEVDAGSPGPESSVHHVLGSQIESLVFEFRGSEVQKQSTAQLR